MTTPWLLTTPVCVWDARAILGEGPVWDGRSLWWTDIKSSKVHRYSPSSRAQVSWSAPEPVGSFVIERDGRLLAAMKSGFAYLVPGEPGGTMDVVRVCQPEAGLPQNRFNDGKRAPDGSFWAGSMDEGELNDTGSWWRLGPDGRARQLDTGFRVTNGPAFDLDRGRVYLTDSARQIVFVADLIAGGAGFSRKRQFLRFGDGEGFPDGMEVDAHGCLWIAFWDGGCLRRFSPQGKCIQTVRLPVSRPTSLAFAGSRIFVTSASVGVEQETLAGGLFCLERVVYQSMSSA